MRHVKIGLHQADLMLAKRFIEKESHVLVSSDSDFCVHVGTRICMLKHFKYDMRNKTMHDVALVFVDNDLATNARDDLIKLGNDKAVLFTAEYKLFSNNDSLETRGFYSLVHGEWCPQRWC